MIILGDKMKYFHEKNRIYVKDNNDIIGEVSFTENKDGVIEITHTYVSFEYRGQHLASHLLEELSIRLEKENKLCIPICSYAVKWFQKHVEKQRLIKK